VGIECNEDLIVAEKRDGGIILKAAADGAAGARTICQID
jgi:hypothetical protein